MLRRSSLDPTPKAAAQCPERGWSPGYSPLPAWCPSARSLPGLWRPPRTARARSWVPRAPSEGADRTTCVPQETWERKVQRNRSFGKEGQALLVWDRHRSLLAPRCPTMATEALLERTGFLAFQKPKPGSTSATTPLAPSPQGRGGPPVPPCRGQFSALNRN